MLARKQVVPVLLFLFFVNSLTLAHGDNRPIIRFVAPIDKAAKFNQEIQEAVASFNSKEKSFRVKLIQPAGYFKTLQAIIASNYAGDLPDVALVNQADLGTLKKLSLLKTIPKKWGITKNIPKKLHSPLGCKKTPCSVTFQRFVPIWFFNQELLLRLNQSTAPRLDSIEDIGTLSINLNQELKKAPLTKKINAITVPNRGDFTLDLWTALGLRIEKNTFKSASTFINNLKGHSIFLSGETRKKGVVKFIDQETVFYLGNLLDWIAIKNRAKFKWNAMLPTGKLFWHGTDLVLLKQENANQVGKLLKYIFHWKIKEKFPAHLSTRKRKAVHANTFKIAPQLREDWTKIVWKELHQRTNKKRLKAKIQKLLSTNAR